MNLVRDKWMRVMMKDGSDNLLSLDEVFENAESIVTLQESMPGKVSCISLLATIAQASIGKLRNDMEWESCRPDIISKSRSYLSKYVHSFDLYGKTPFFQVPIVKNIHDDPYRSTVNGMSFERPFGDRTAFFDHNAHKWNPTDIEIANMILPYSMFDLGGIFKKPNTWENNKIITSKSAAPLCKKLLMIVEGTCLLDTIWYHVFPEDKMGNLDLGRPFWELKLSSRKDFQDYALTYFGQLLPIARSMLLNQGTNKMFIGETLPVQCKGGKSLWNEVRHPMMIEKVEKSGKNKGTHDDDSDGKAIVNFRESVWRQLGAILAMNNDPDKLAWAFGHARTKGKLYLYVGGLTLSKAEIGCPIESVFCLSPECDKTLWVNNYADLFSKANKISSLLGCAISVYSDVLKLGKERKKSLSSAAGKSYWSTMSTYVNLLFRASDTNSASHIEDRDKWIKTCWREARNTYDSVASMYTENSCEAYGMGSARLNYDSIKGD